MGGQQSVVPNREDDERESTPAVTCKELLSWASDPSARARDLDASVLAIRNRKDVARVRRIISGARNDDSRRSEYWKGHFPTALHEISRAGGRHVTEKIQLLLNHPAHGGRLMRTDVDTLLLNDSDDVDSDDEDAYLLYVEEKAAVTPLWVVPPRALPHPPPPPRSHPTLPLGCLGS